MTITLNGTTGIVSPKVNALDLELDSKNVVERGSNANGDYVRFADGTQICTKKGATPDAVPAAFLWPAAFLGTGYSASGNSSGSTTASDITIKFSLMTTSGGNILATVNGTGTAAVGYTAIAIGRWY